MASAKKTGRVLVLQNDRMYAGYGREIQGDLVETLPGTIVRLLGQKNMPAVGQARTLENATVVTDEGIEKAILSLARAKPAAWLENELHWLGHAPGRSTT